jgi:hypothetical protein
LSHDTDRDKKKAKPFRGDITAVAANEEFVGEDFSPMEILLQSVPAANEILRADLGGKRSDVPLQNGVAVVLGKNAITGIADSSVKRKMIRVQAIDHRFVRLEALVTEWDKISVNGKSINAANITLRNNDVLSLHGETYSYSYKVIILKKPQPRHLPPIPHSSSPSTKSSFAKKRKAPPVTSTITADLTEEFSCPVCLDLFVEATSLVRCCCWLLIGWYLSWTLPFSINIYLD